MNADDRRTRSLRPGWGPWALPHLLLILAALAAGLWPDAVHPRRADLRTVLPVLRTLCVAEAVFCLLAYPLVWLRRFERDPRRPLRRFWVRGIGELGLCGLTALPPAGAGAWLQDAVAADVVRTGLFIVALWPVSLCAARLLLIRRARTAGLLALLVLTLGAPAAWYVFRDLLPIGEAAWLWDIGPLTAGWSVAASRRGGIVPDPLWPSLLWIVAAGAGLLAASVAVSLRPGRKGAP